MAVNQKIPKSRLMIQYDTKVDGVKKKKELPYRTLMMGNVSNGTSKEAQLPLQDRNIHSLENGVDAVMKAMNIPINLKVANYINPSKSAVIDVDYVLSGMKDFKPDQIAEKVPQIKALLKLRDMLVSFEKDIDNNRHIKDSIDQIFSNEQEINDLKSSLPISQYSFDRENSKQIIKQEEE